MFYEEKQARRTLGPTTGETVTKNRSTNAILSRVATLAHEGSAELSEPLLCRRSRIAWHHRDNTIIAARFSSLSIA